MYNSTSRESLLQSTPIYHSLNYCKELINSFFSVQFRLFRKELVSEALCHYAATVLLFGACRHICLADFMLLLSPSLQQTTRPQPQAQWGNVSVMWFLKFGSLFLHLAKAYSFPCSEAILFPVNDSCVNTFKY